jgi:putative ABC transport system permease protein
MWRNYLTVGLRALAKNRTYAVINVVGLAIGMAACLMILLFVRYEMSYDRWIPGNEDVYQVQSWYHDHQTGRDDRLQMTAYASEAALTKDFPQIQAIVYGSPTEPVFMKNGEATKIADFLYVDGDFLKVMPLPMASGGAGALAAPNSLVMTETEAKRLYGTTDVVGRPYTVVSRGAERSFKITGILKDLPKNSHIQASTIARVDYPALNSQSPANLTCWGCQSGWVWARFKPGTDVKALEAQLPAWEKRNIPDDTVSGASTHTNPGDDQDWHFVNVRDIHLGPAQNGAMRPGNDRTTIVTFAIIALLILAMAVVNFTNLATARASQRAREVALRKVLGASRKQLIVQFIGESVLISMLAMLIALALVELLMPRFAAFLDADIKLAYFGAGGILLPVLGLVVAVGVLGGLYPAFFLSRFQPATVLKANKSSAEAAGTGRLRSILVVGQFAVSIGLIICTAVVYAQTVYARTADPGYKRDHILQVSELSRAQLFSRGEAIEEATRRVPGVDAVGRTTIGVATRNQNNTGVLVPGQAEPVNIGQYIVDAGFKDAMGLTLVAGRWFDDNRPLDDMTTSYPPDPAVEKALAQRGANIVVNELATRRLGFRHPADALGKTFQAGLVSNEAGLVPATIVGIVKDSRFRSVREPIEPILFQSARSGQSEMIVRFHGDPAAVRAGVEQAWRRVASDVPFSAGFSEDLLVELYKADDARAKTFAAFALLAVIVACLGLFGLASFTAERRTKEIGIRKVLGARTRDIVRLLVWQFSKPVIVANLIAWPAAWWVMRGWLNGFDTRIGLGPSPFLLAGTLALAIAVATVAGHAIRVARSNPIHALRYE